MGKKKKKLSSTERWEEEPTGRNNNKKINCLELLCVCVYYFSKYYVCVCLVVAQPLFTFPLDKDPPPVLLAVCFGRTFSYTLV